MGALFDGQSEKQQALSRMKWIATALFMLVTAMYLLARVWLISDLTASNSNISAHVSSAVLDIGEQLGADVQMRQWINETVQRIATALVEQNRQKIGKFIADQVSAWDDRHMVEQVELNIGKDLQYIRINGTLVGGLVGLLIFGFNRLLA